MSTMNDLLVGVQVIARCMSDMNAGRIVQTVQNDADEPLLIAVIETDQKRIAHLKALVKQWDDEDKK